METEGVEALETKLQSAARCFRNRDDWLESYERMAVLFRLAVLMEPQREKFSRLIARFARIGCRSPVGGALVTESVEFPGRCVR